MSREFLYGMIGATKLGVVDLTRVIRTAPRRYKVYEIDKRRGGKRTIAHPSKELKTLQRWLLETYLTDLPVSKSALAYVKGRSIRENALKHTNQRFIIKLDFENFFPSLKVEDWDKYVALKRCRLRLDQEDRVAMRQILFWGDGTSVPHYLSIGAPTSPIVSNILMLKFDAKVVKAIDPIGVVYTRYADDITISGNDLAVLIAAEKTIVSIVKRQRWPILKLNAQKRGLYAKGVKQMVTGLILTPEGSVSLGRERKRLIHAMLHRYMNGKLQQAEKKQLQGFIGFAIANEPNFVKSLKQKYGDLNVRRAQAAR